MVIQSNISPHPTACCSSFRRRSFHLNCSSFHFSSFMNLVFANDNFCILNLSRSATALAKLPSHSFRVFSCFVQQYFACTGFPSSNLYTVPGECDRIMRNHLEVRTIATQRENLVQDLQQNSNHPPHLEVTK